MNTSRVDEESQNSMVKAAQEAQAINQGKLREMGNQAQDDATAQGNDEAQKLKALAGKQRAELVDKRVKGASRPSNANPNATPQTARPKVTYEDAWRHDLPSPDAAQPWLRN